MRILKHFLGIGLLAFCVNPSLAGNTNGFECQTVPLPARGAPQLFADVDGDGLMDFLTVNTISKNLLVYRQRPNGFGNAADQTIALLPQTAWLSPFRVEFASKGCELVMSTAAGIFYFRQNHGVFESTPRTLCNVSQMFTNDAEPTFLLPGTNIAIPVITESQAWLYRQNESSQWTSGPPALLESKHNDWSGYRNAWTMGANSSHNLAVYESLYATPFTSEADEKPENEALGKLITEMDKAGAWHKSQRTKVDLNHDGQTDFILWQQLGDIESKTDLYIYLRGADGKLPERPNQILHCRGFPLPIGTQDGNATPVGDLKGDGNYELVLLEPKMTVPSLSGMADMALSQGVPLRLTVREFRHGEFSRSAEAETSLTCLLSWYGTRQWPFFVDGDFNGDGRPDLLAQRLPGRWEIYPSTTDGHWFKSQPAMELEMPAQGYFARRSFEIMDLNGDGHSDIVLRDLDDPRIFIFFTQPPLDKGKP